MFLDFFRKSSFRARPATNPTQTQRALALRQADKIAELRANGFRALARWFSENPERIG